MTGIVRHPLGPRVYVKGMRVHHGSAGCVLALAAAALHQPLVLGLAAWMIASDRQDFPWRDCDNHVPRRKRNRVAGQAA